MGRAEETRGLLAHPESMGGPSDDDFGDVAPTWRDRVRRRVPYLNWRNCRYAAVCLVLLLITIGFLVSGITSVKKDVSTQLTYSYLLSFHTYIYTPGSHHPPPNLSLILS
jgi:hypothetical protein